ncbi:MAG: glycosyltransferase [Anaeromyxobacter sp.]|nr:glycosyltransferase [Anaeromyxobacter sp.]MBL0276759.1 glycosyltransferase [Anaeromyxobacter sp.]
MRSFKAGDGASAAASRPATAGGGPSSPSPLPRPPFPAAARAPRGSALLASVAIDPGHDGTFELAVTFQEGLHRFGGRARFPCAAPLGAPSLPNPVTGAAVAVTPGDLLDFLANGYDQPREAAAVLAGAAAGASPRVAFTVRSSSVKGGGTLTLFRWVNWLAELGVAVAVYSDDYPPDWTTVNARFHCLPDPAVRYAAIEEPVVVVYSVLEVPLVLQHLPTRGRRVVHLCQGAEDFHYGPPPPGGLLSPNAAFDLLNSLPVERLVVSPHLLDYFQRKYGQRSLLVPNGIDLELFSPGPRPPPSGRLTVLCAGNPTHPLKGVGVVKAALALLARRRPDWRLHLVNVCGEPLLSPPEPGGPGFTGELRCRVSGPEMRDLFRGSDAYVNASWYEGFGLPSLEAMACGLPVVQCDNPGLEGIVQGGHDCLAAAVGSAEAIAAALERLLGDAALRDRLTRAGLETAGRWSLDQQRDALVAAFSTLTGVDLAAHARPAPPPGAPLFSVLVPVVGPAPHLAAALESLTGQGEPRWEALVVYDGADAGAAATLARLAGQDPRLRALPCPGATLSTALAVGLAEATARRICWLPPDERLLPDKLEVHLVAERADPAARFTHTGHRRRHPSGGADQPASPPAAQLVPPGPLQVLELLQQGYLATASVVLDRCVLDAVGGFGDAPPGQLAHALWLRLSRRFRSRFLDRDTCVRRPPQGAAAARQADAEAGQAARAFLEAHTFPDLFPLLDLDHPDQAVHAVAAALRVATDPGALLALAAGQPLLLDRVAAWLGGAPAPARAACRQALLQLGRGGGPPDLRAAVARLHDAAGGPAAAGAPSSA